MKRTVDVSKGIFLSYIIEGTLEIVAGVLGFLPGTVFRVFYYIILGLDVFFVLAIGHHIKGGLTDERMEENSKKAKLVSYRIKSEVGFGIALLAFIIICLSIKARGEEYLNFTMIGHILLSTVFIQLGCHSIIEGVFFRKFEAE